MLYTHFANVGLSTHFLALGPSVRINNSKGSISHNPCHVSSNSKFPQWLWWTSTKYELFLFYQVRWAFLCWSINKDGHPGLWLSEMFSKSALQAEIGIWSNLTGSKYPLSSTKLAFFGPIRQQRWPPWPLIDWKKWLLLWNRWAEMTKFDRK